jgi:hypothetical protein
MGGATLVGILRISDMAMLPSSVVCSVYGSLSTSVLKRIVAQASLARVSDVFTVQSRVP